MKVAAINLIPPARLAARRLRRRRCAWIAGLCAHAALVAAASMAARQIWSPASPAVAAELNETRIQISQLNTQLAQQRRSSVELAARRSFIDTIANKPDWSLLLKLLDHSAGDDIVLRECHLQPGTNQLLSFSVGGIAATQSGVTQFVSRLAEVDLFRDIKLGRTERQPFGTGSGIAFQLTCSIDNSAGALP